MKARQLALGLATLALTGCSLESQPFPEISQPPLSTPPVSAASTPTPSASESPMASPAADEPFGDLATLLAGLEIASEYPSGYDRDLFQHWIDADSDGCNARGEVLIAEAIVKPQISGSCNLLGGQWYSHYDGVLTEDPGSFAIDHVVPLKEAWDSGAYQWSSATRKTFANDLAIPESLIAVTASSNRSKSDRDPSQWLPYEQGYLCEYTKAWLLIKTRWQLTIDSAEALALGTLVSNCSNVKAEAPPLAAIFFGTAPTKGANGEDPRFDSCREAKANGYGPYTN
ncbi:MAG: hypothetical protein RLZZ579_431, partial [Actinomycetota bacterium]